MSALIVVVDPPKLPISSVSSIASTVLFRKTTHLNSSSNSMAKTRMCRQTA